MADARANDRRLKNGAANVDSSGMGSIPSVTANGLDLLGRAERRLAASAQTFARSGATADQAVPSADTTVDAAVGVIYGRSEFRIGLALIAVGRDTEKQLLDVIA